MILTMRLNLTFVFKIAFIGHDHNREVIFVFYLFDVRVFDKVKKL